MTALDADFEAQLAALRAKFAGNLTARIDEMAAAADAIAASREVSGRRALERVLHLAHKLAGSAATFGFKTVSDEAYVLEQLCAARLEANEPAEADAAAISGAISAIREAAGRGPDG